MALKPATTEISCRRIPALTTAWQRNAATALSKRMSKHATTPTTLQTDECLNDCSSPTCGDGIVRAGVEACDDGNQDNNDGCSNACTENRRPCSVVAAAWCTAKGWRVAGGAQGGNIVCTVDGRGTGSNCDTCSTYNIIVWRNGSKERHCVGHSYSTRAGTFYSAHTPCRCGDNLDACGQWDMQNCIPD